MLGEDGAKWGAGEKSAFIIDGKTWVNNHVHILRTGENIFDIWLMHYLNWCDLSPYISGVTVPKLTQKRMLEIPVPVPSLPEQERIVGILDAAFEKIDAVQRNAERNLANAKELFQRVLDEEMTPKKGWSAAPLKDLTTDLGDGIHGTPLYDSSGDYYFINGNNLERGKIVFREKTKRVSISEAKKYTLPLNDKTVLVSINGTLGRVAFYQGEKIVLGKSACYFNLRECIDKNFAYLIFSSEIFMRYAKKEATGVTINNVSLKSMRNFLIYYPNLSEQKSIVQIIRKFQERLFLAAQRSSETISICEKLKTALLAKAFNGEL